MSIEIQVTEEYNNVKPKNFLTKKIDLPYYKILKLIKDKRITLNGKKIKKESIIRTGDIIKIWPHDINFREIKKNHQNMKDLNIPILYENEDFMVLNKLPNVVVQGAQHNNMSISLHLAYHKNKIGDKSDFEYFHVHRLDKDTSGCLVIAKNPVTLRDLNEVFRTKNILKKYTCLCIGEFEKKEGIVELFLKRNPEGSREKMGIVKTKEKDAKKSISIYKVIKEFDYKDDIFSLVEVQIKTGVTHQIRVHMKYLGHPIVGDKMYGNSNINKMLENKLDRQFLHASSLQFEYKAKEYKFEAPLTEDLNKVLKSLQII